jgi:hypothetical protein
VLLHRTDNREHLDRTNALVTRDFQRNFDSIEKPGTGDNPETRARKLTASGRSTLVETEKPICKASVGVT